MSASAVRNLLAASLLLQCPPAMAGKEYLMRIIPPGSSAPIPSKQAEPPAEAPGGSPATPGAGTPGGGTPSTPAPQIEKVEVTLSPPAVAYRARTGDDFVVNAHAGRVSPEGTWSLAAGSTLPPGAGFSAEAPFVGGRLSGPGTSSFAFALRDATSRTEGTSPSVSVTVAPPPTLTFAKASYVSRVDVPFMSDTPQFSEFVEPPAFRVSGPQSGDLQANDSGVILGMFTVPTSEAVVGLTATDAWDNRSATASISVLVHDRLGFASSPNDVSLIGNGEIAIQAPAPKGLIGTPSYRMYRNNGLAMNALESCGMSLDTASGTLRALSSRPCSVDGITLGVHDDAGGNAALATDAVSQPFAVRIADVFSVPPAAALADQATQAAAACTGVPVSNLSAKPLPGPSLSLDPSVPEIQSCAPTASPCGATIPAGATCNVGARLAANRDKAYSATGTVTVAGVGSTAVALSARSSYTALALSASPTVTLQTQTTATGACSDVAVTNTSAVAVSGLAFAHTSGGPAIAACPASANPCGTSLAGKASGKVGARLAATLAGNFQGLGEVTATGQTPLTVQLVGTSTYSAPVSAVQGYSLNNAAPSYPATASAAGLSDDDPATFVTVTAGDRIFLVFSKPVSLDRLVLSVTNPGSSNISGSLTYQYYDVPNGAFAGTSVIQAANLAPGKSDQGVFGLPGAVTTTMVRLYNGYGAPIRISTYKGCNASGCQ